MNSSTLSSHSRTILIETGSQTQSQMHPQSQQSLVNQSTSEEYMQKIKHSLQMSKQELIQLINRNQFTDKVFCFNNQAKKLIQANKIQQALIYLNEAQKILQYAASSGKNIERKRIVQVLHNQACSYQILWDLEKCSNYIEALIFNFNSELKFGEFPHSNNPSEIHMSGSKKSLSSQSRIEAQKIEKKVDLVKYYLLYCAINSQLKNNQGALIAAKKASEISKNIIQELLDIFEEEKQTNSSFIQILPPFVYPMLQQIPKISTSISPNKTEDMLLLVRHYIKVYNSKCVFNNLSSSKGFHSSINTKEIYQKYKNYSIGNIMQLQPIGDTSQSEKNVIDSSSQNCQPINYEKLIQKLILFSICQFTMATELRYIALNQAKNDKDKSQQMIEFKESESYHLLSVLIVAMFMPFDIVYMEHIISSYHGHYKTVLLSNGLDGTAELTQDQIKRIKESVVFLQKESHTTSCSSKKQQKIKKCSTTNQSNSSLIVSIHQQDDQQELHQPSNKKQKQSSNKKTKNKQHNQHSFANHQNDLSDEQRHMFDYYYYVKKDTEQDHGDKLAYEENRSVIKKQSSNGVKNVKSKSKTKKSLVKSNSKKILNSNRDSSSRSKINTEESIEEVQKEKENQPAKRQSRKSQFKSKPSVFFQSKPSTLMIPLQNSKENASKLTSQRPSHGMHSPGLVPLIYGKITKCKQSKSRENKKKSQSNTECIKQQSEYFNKCNFSKKNDKNRDSNQKENLKPGKGKKSRSNKKPLETRREDAIRTEYFQVHNPNIVRDNKMGNKKATHNEGGRKSVSKGKKERLSSKSLTKALSQNGLVSKYSNMKNSHKQVSEMSKQKRIRHTQGLGSIYMRQGSSNRRSVSTKKSQRVTVHKQTDINCLATEESGTTMKGSHFNNYYL